MRRCCCGNELAGDPGFLVTHSPCRCKRPGPGRSAILRESFLDDITPNQYAERMRAGLPIVAEIEKSVLKEIR